MNFYLAAVDELVCHPDDNPSIGLILCKEKNRIVVEFALKTSRHPVGVTEYKFTKKKKKKYQGELLTPKELRQQLRQAAKLTSKNKGAMAQNE